MKTTLRAIALLCLLLTAGVAEAQVKSLSDIKSDKPYLLRNANGFGYCVFNPQIDDARPTLGETIVNHSSGCVNDHYHDPINNHDAKNQWYIIKGDNGNYFLRNAETKSYISNETESPWGFPWGGWGGGKEYGIWFFTDEAVALSVEEYSTGVWMFRVKGAADANNNTSYLCAASHSQTAMANWMPDDLGSQWEILSVEDDSRLYHNNGDNPNEPYYPDDNEGLGEIIPEGPIHYFHFRDEQLIAIPEQFILDREETEQFLTLTLMGDTTITLSRYALAKETTETPEDLPVMESFKFNNKFNDQLFTDAEGVIDNETNTIQASVGCIGKYLTASIKLSDEEDALGTKVWVDGKRNVSKETRRRFDKDIVYTVARPRQFMYKVSKTQNELWNVDLPNGGDNPGEFEPWTLERIDLTIDQLSTNAPSNQPNSQGLQLVLDGNDNTYFHTTWGSGEYQKLQWESGNRYGDGVSEWPYIQIELAEPVENFVLDLTTGERDRRVDALLIQGSNDGEVWSDLTTFHSETDFPTEGHVRWTSPVIEAGQPYAKLRLQATECVYKNYMTLSELKLMRATANVRPEDPVNPETPDSVLIRPALYARQFAPFGRDYTVHVDFLSEQGTTEYGLPRIDILFGDSVHWDNTNWIGRNGKTYYEDASITIDGAGIFPDMPKTHLLIRGRGNSSWSQSSNSKNPYRLKFDEKVKPFGMTKGKSWVLLANKQSNSMTTNAIAMKIADMVESEGCNHIIPVELYINGHYRGSYNFTEKIGFSNNSIDLDDETYAVMLELDSYYDEAYKFRDNSYNLYVNVKEPDLAALDTVPDNPLTFDLIQNTFNSFTSCVKSGNYTHENANYSPLDVQSFVRAWFVTDLTRNTEEMHPKSWFVYCDNVYDGHRPWHFGPVWDFDWSFGYEGTSTYFQHASERDIFSNWGSIGSPFFQQLVQGSDIVQREYYRLWTHFMNEGKLEELIDFCDDYLAVTEASFQHNAEKWSDGRNYANITTNAKNWLRKRANWIYRNLTPYDLGDDIIVTPDDDWGTPDGELEAEKPSDWDNVNIINMAAFDRPINIFNLHGQKVATLRPSEVSSRHLPSGIYLVNGKKVVVR